MLGLDLLGIASKHWKISGTIAAFPLGFALGVIDGDFGDAIPNVRRLLDTGKVPAVRAHMGFNKHVATSIEVLKKRLPLWEALAKQYPSVRFYISHSCEDGKTSLNERAKRVNLVKSLCPSCIPVQCPMGGSKLPGVMLEVHGAKAHAKVGQIISSDGNEIQQMKANEWVTSNLNAEICFLWGARFNLRQVETPEHPSPPPKERTAYASARYIKGIARLGASKEIAPTPVFQATPFAAPILWKAYGEDYPTKPGQKADPRANKPVAMLPEKASYAEVVTFQGVTVAKLPLYKDSHPHKLERYYSGLPGGADLYAYEIGERAKGLSGYETCWIKIKKKYYGPICPPFRTAPFQV